MPRFVRCESIENECQNASVRVSRSLSDLLNCLKFELAHFAELAVAQREPTSKQRMELICSKLSADVEAIDALREQCEFRLSSIAGRHADR